jgi:alkanesulfonate monooxygenase SsuD/methylene tetrahydromethanopterin reductase-like flavin-dependent oxidoreductase (luciferase family)
MTTLGLFSLMGLHDRNTSPASVLRTTVDMVRMAEDFGFDTAWFAEHHFTNHSICPASLMMIAHCAPVTTRIKLGTAVIAAPFHDPLRLVQEVVFADLLTSGRLVVGLGTGYQPYEFSRFGIDASTKVQRTMEIWDILEQGMREGRIEYSGKFYQIPETHIPLRAFSPKPPEFFITSRNPDMVARCVRGGHTPFYSFGNRDLASALSTRQSIAASWRNGGGDPDCMPLAIQRFIYITEDKNDAEHAARCVRNLARAWITLQDEDVPRNGPFVRLMPLNDERPLEDFLSSAVIGPADYCAEKLLEEISVLRPSHLCCLMGPAGIGRSETLASLERFGSEVMPKLSEVLEAPNVLEEA